MKDNARTFPAERWRLRVMGWTGERVDLLKTLWMEGRSASQCAARIGGVSRNAVIGKVRRLGLPFRTHHGTASNKSRIGCTPVRSPNKGTDSRPAKLDYAVLGDRAPHTGTTRAFLLSNMGRIEPLPPSHASDIARVSFMDLDEIEIAGSKRHCRYIPMHIDPKEIKPSDKQFCGMPKVTGLPYCEHHRKRCHSPPALNIRVSVKAPSKAKEFA